MIPAPGPRRFLPEVAAVEHRDREPRLCEEVRTREADDPAADDRHIRMLRHAGIVRARLELTLRPPHGIDPVPSPGFSRNERESRGCAMLRIALVVGVACWWQPVRRRCGPQAGRRPGRAPGQLEAAAVRVPGQAADAADVMKQVTVVFDKNEYYLYFVDKDMKGKPKPLRLALANVALDPTTTRRRSPSSSPTAHSRARSATASTNWPGTS